MEETKRIKPYEELKFTDDFIFWKVMSNNLNLCRELLELILNVKIKEVRLAQGQDKIQLIPDSRSVILDVYVDDVEGTAYDIDMQTTITGDLRLRIRYYQSVIDLNMLEPGDSFMELRKSYVIFICLSDMFGRGRAIYRFRNICVDDETLELDDGTEKVIINAAGSRAGLSKKMCSFLDFLVSSKASDDFTSSLDEAVKIARNNPKWRQQYMKWEADAALLKEEGRNEGREEGITIGAARQKAADTEENKDAIKSLFSDGTSVDSLYKAFGSDVVNSVIGQPD